MKHYIAVALMLCALLLFPGYGSAALTSLGTGTVSGGGDYNIIYDDALGIIWLDYRNASVNWQNAMDWAADLSVSFDNQTYNDWRLPEANPINGSTYNYAWSSDGSTDRGYEISAPGTSYEGSTENEMAHLYYNGLGNSSDTSGNGPEYTGVFSSLAGYAYWTEASLTTSDSYALIFAMQYGYQDYKLKSFNYSAMAVHSYQPIPVPPAILLLISGFGVLAIFRRKLQK